MFYRFGPEKPIMMPRKTTTLPRSSRTPPVRAPLRETRRRRTRSSSILAGLQARHELASRFNATPQSGTGTVEEVDRGEEDTPQRTVTAEASEDVQEAHGCKQTGNCAEDKTRDTVVEHARDSGEDRAQDIVFLQPRSTSGLQVDRTQRDQEREKEDEQARDVVGLEDTVMYLEGDDEKGLQSEAAQG